MRRMSSLSILFAHRGRAARNLELRSELFFFLPPFDELCFDLSHSRWKIFQFCTNLITDAISPDLFCLFWPLCSLSVWNSAGESPNCRIYSVEGGEEANGCASSGLIYPGYSRMCAASQIHHEVIKLSAAFIFVTSTKCSQKKDIISGFNWQFVVNALSGFS